MRVLVIGAEGQVSRALLEAGAGRADMVVGRVARPEVDLTRTDNLASAFERFAPDVVVNPAAYTAVDRAEAESGLAFTINRDGAGAVAAAAGRVGAPVIHLSTDYVFDGRKDGPYVEADPVAPQGVYGRSKLDGEVAVAAANPKAVILRTSWVYAPYGANFVRTMVRLSSERERLRVVDDQVGCPTYAPDIAAAVLSIAARLGAGWDDAWGGVTHLAGPDALSWCDFARRIMSELASRGAPSPPVDAITTAEYPTPATRPANSRLATARLACLFQLRLPPLDQSLHDCLDRMALQDAGVR